MERTSRHTSFMCRGEMRTPRPMPGAEGSAPKTFERQLAPTRQPDFLSQHPSQFLYLRVRGTRASRTRRRTDSALCAHHRRKTGRPRFGLSPADQCRDGACIRRIADLPHRSLSGKRNRSKLHGRPVRQQHFRADLEPQVHRSRADHRQRSGRRRHQSSLLRRSRAPCATWCRTICCSCSVWSPWSRPIRSTPTSCATRRWKSSAASGPSPVRMSRCTPSVPNMLRARPGANRCPAIAGRTALSPTPRRKPMWRSNVSWRTGAGPACRFICAPAKPCLIAPARSPCSSRTSRRSCSTPIQQQPQPPNVLALRIQPEEGLSLRIVSRVPGTRAQTHPVEMDFQYSDVFGRPSPEAYERLLLDVMAGDASRFMRRDAVEASWAWITQILEGWQQQGATMVAGISSRNQRTRRGRSSHPTGWPDLAPSLRLSQGQLLENFFLRSHPADKPLEMSFAIQGQRRQRTDFQLGRNLKIVLDVHREDEHLSRDFHVQLSS